VIKKQLFVLIFVLCGTFSYGQRAYRKLSFTSHGPFSLPENSVDSGVYTPNGMGWIEMVHLSNRGHLYAASNSGGLYRYNKQNESWKALKKLPVITGVTDMVSEPKKAKKIFIATANTAWDQDWGIGIWYSRNGGKRWQMTGLNFRPSEKTPLWQLEASPVDFSHQIALSENQIFVSYDGWKSYEEVLSIEKEAFRELCFKPASGDTIYAAGRRLWRSLDAGKSWQDISGSITSNNRDEYRRIAIEVNPNYPEYLWVAVPEGNKVSLNLSRDGGGHFEHISSQTMIRRFDENHAELEVAPDDTMNIYLGAVRLFGSKDGGKTFTRLTVPRWNLPNFQHDDIRELLVLNNGILYNGNDGGVGLSTDHGSTWTDLSKQGLTVTQFYGIDYDPNTGRVVGGCQDLGNMVYDEGDNKWRNVSELYGDGGEVINLSEREGWIVTQNGTLFESDRMAKDWKVFQSQSYIGRMWMPMEEDVRQNGQIYVFDNQAFRLVSGSRHQNISNGLPNTYFKIWAFKQSPALPDRAFLAFDEPTWDASATGLRNKLFISNDFTDQDPSWQDVTSNLGILAWRGISSIALHPENPDRIWVSFKTFDDSEKVPQRVYYSEDGGKSWSNYSNGLPSVRANTLLYAGGESELMFLGTDVGLYAKRWYDPEWVLVGGSKSLPYGMISDLEWDDVHKRLWIATYGLGLWSVTVPDRLLR
jgi:hypothetical protein